MGGFQHKLLSGKITKENKKALLTRSAFMITWMLEKLSPLRNLLNSLLDGLFNGLLYGFLDGLLCSRLLRRCLLYSLFNSHFEKIFS